MGLNFRKSIKIAPGVKLNFGKKSASVSVGPRGAKITTGTNGTSVSAGIPGTGLYYREKLSNKSKGTSMPSNQKEMPLRTEGENYVWGIIFAIIAAIIFIVALVANLQPFGRVILGGIGALMTFGSVVFFFAKSSDQGEKDYSNALITDPPMFVAGILIIIGCIVIYSWSTGWEWYGHSRTNIHIRHDFSWFKNILYTFLVICGIIGAAISLAGCKHKED